MRSIWAVAANTIRQALRLKVAVIFIILLLTLLPAMAATMTGDGTLKGRLQSFVSYGLSLTSLLLCLLTIIISIYSMTSDFQQKQIYTVLTKPIRRFQLLMGKLLGVVLLDIVLLAIFSAVIYAIAIFMPRYYKASQDELYKVNNQFFTARASLVPADVDVTKEVQEAFEKLKKDNQLSPNVYTNKKVHDNLIEELTERIKLGKRAAAPGKDLLWEFHNVKPLGYNQSIFIKFKYDVSVNPPDLQVSSKWLIGDVRNYGMNKEARVHPIQRKDLIRTFCEIEVPADAVAQDGYLAVAFLNDPELNNTVVIFPPEDGLEVLYKSDTFTANFTRAVLLILFRLLFLASLGILASSFLSFPVAILLCLVVFFTGSISGFIIESFGENALGANWSLVYSYTIKWVVLLLPQFDKFNPVDFMVSAKLLSWFLLAKVAGIMIGIQSLILLVLALVIFGRREIAKIII